MRFNKLIFCFFLAFILLLSLFSPVTRSFWHIIDTEFFKFWNTPLKNHEFLRQFWAIANHKSMDWFEDIAFLALAARYYVAPINKTRARKLAEMIFAFLVIALVIVLINRLLMVSQTFNIPRMSPTLVLEHPVRLSEYISWLKVKDFAYKSFPGDHATTALLYAFLYTHFAGKRLGIGAWCLAIFFCLPRLVVGAHWLSDAVVGSGSIILCSSSLLLYTPIKEKVVGFFERQFIKIRKKLQTLSPREGK